MQDQQFLVSSTRCELKGGGSLVFVERPSTQTVVLRLDFRVGPQHETEYNNGLACLAYRMLLEGNRTRDHRQISQDFEKLGVEVLTLVNGIQLTFLNRFSTQVIENLKDLLLSMEPRRDRFDLVRQRLLEDVVQNLDDSDTLAHYHSRLQSYAAGPGRLLPAGSPKSLIRLGFDDVKEFQERFFHRDNLRFYLVGNIKGDEFQKELCEALSEFRHGSCTPPQPHKSEYSKQISKRIVVKDKNKSSIVLSHGGVLRWSEDYSKLKALDQLLGSGSGFTSHLTRRLREELGLCYSVYSEITGTAGKIPGLFLAYIGTSPETARQAIEEIINTIEVFQNFPHEEESLEDVKRYLLGSQVFQFESNPSWMQLIAERDEFDLEEDFLIRERQIFQEITLDDIAELSQNYIHPQKLNIMVVGKNSLKDFEVVQPKIA